MTSAARNTALLVIDVQQTLSTGEWACFEVDAMIERINSLIARARAIDLPVVMIQHDEAEGPLVRHGPGWQLAPALAAKPSDLYIYKQHCDAFQQTPLWSELSKRGVDHVIVCGMQTDFCVNATVRSAVARGCNVTLVADGHTTIAANGKAALEIIAEHNEALQQVRHGDARVAAAPADALP